MLKIDIANIFSYGFYAKSEKVQCNHAKQEGWLSKERINAHGKRQEVHDTHRGSVAKYWNKVQNWCDILTILKNLIESFFVWRSCGS
jgi:hypothetical protein